MHRFVSLFIIASLLAVSSVPLLPNERFCVSDSIAAEHDGHAHARPMHHHYVQPVGDWQKSRIECGCGCHRDADSLPHLLAPHVFADSGQDMIISIVRVPPDVFAVPAYLPVRVPLPPPELS